MKKRVIALLLAAVMTVGMLAGCSGSSESGSSTGADSSEASSSEQGGVQQQKHLYLTKKLMC